MSSDNPEKENEAFVVFAERWLDEQFEWAMQQKRLHPDDGPWRRGAGTAEERLMDALHHLQQALILYDGCRDDRRAAAADVAEVLRRIPGSAGRLERAQGELARGEGIPISDLDKPEAE